jgi:hypothetical protein
VTTFSYSNLAGKEHSASVLFLTVLVILACHIPEGWWVPAGIGVFVVTVVVSDWRAHQRADAYRKAMQQSSRNQAPARRPR